MGGGSWNSNAWTSFKQTHVTGKTQSQVFSSRGLNEAVDPLKFTNGIRESVDGDDHPETTPVAIFTDATGSMGYLAQVVVTKLDTVAEQLLARNPVSDVHIMTGIVGDAYTDSAPMQATQFESDIRIADQTKLLWLDGCSGGGNRGESYALPWLMMAQQTVTDSFNKRKKKGYIFTVGDEGIHGVEGGNGQKYGVTKEQAERILGLKIERDYTAEEIYAMVSAKFHVYHIVIGQGHKDDIDSSFGRLMPDRLLFIEGDNADLLPELIVSTIEVNEGRNKQDVAKSWGGDTSIVIADAMRSLVTSDGGDAADAAVVRL